VFAVGQSRRVQREAVAEALKARPRMGEGACAVTAFAEVAAPSAVAVEQDWGLRVPVDAELSAVDAGPGVRGASAERDRSARTRSPCSATAPTTVSVSTVLALHWRAPL
jgi:hypothetical protein